MNSTQRTAAALNIVFLIIKTSIDTSMPNTGGGVVKNYVTLATKIIGNIISGQIKTATHGDGFREMSLSFCFY